MFSFLRRQGDKAEERAAKYLKDKGYKILKRNYLCPLGEVDIIAKKDGAIVFVEVKQRSSAGFGGAAAAVTKAKQKKVAKAAASFLKQSKAEYSSLMFDIIAITEDELEHIQNAFVPSGLFI